MAAEYLFSKTYRECFRTYDSALKNRSRVVRYAFVGSFKSLCRKGKFSTLWNLEKNSVLRISVVSESPPESYRKTVMKDITLPTRDCIREC